MSDNAPKPPLIGRVAELAAVEITLSETAGGSGGCLVLTGHPGIGKTSLLGAAAMSATALGLATARGRATELDRVAPLTTLASTLRNASPHPLDLSALVDGGGEGFWFVDQLGEALEEYVAERPLVVILDDAQWADEFSVMAMRVLIPALASSPLRWLLARRAGPRDTAAQSALDWLVETGATQIEVGPLPDQAVAELCRQIIGATPDQTVLTLVGRADGNPFLIEQLLEPLIRSGQIVVSEGVATVVADELPSSFHATVQQRLGGLSEPARQLLRAGGVFGGPFSIVAAASVLGLAARDLIAPSQEALDAGVLSEQDDQLVFRHDLLREAVYNSIPAPVRAAMHYEAAAVLRAEPRSVMEIADHLLRSGPTNDRAAVVELRAAAEQAARRAPTAAATFIVRALELVGEHDPLRPELSAQAVGLLAEAGRVVEAREVGERALRSRLDSATEVAVLLGLAEAVKHGGMNADAARYARRALAIESVPEATRAKLHAVLAHSQMYGGDLRVADRAGADAQRYGTAAGEFAPAVFGLVARSVVARTEGRLGEALRYATDAVELADRSGGTARHRHPRAWLGSALAAFDRLDDALTVLADGEREARDLGLGWSMPLWHFIRASVLTWRADLDGAVAEAEAGLRIAEQLTARQLSVPMLGLLTRIAIVRADLPLAEQHLTRMRRLLADGITAAPEDVAWTFATYHEALGEPEFALRELAGLYDQMPGRQLLLIHDSANAAALVRIALAAEDSARADAAVNAVRALADRNPGVTSLAAAAAHAYGLRHGDVSALFEATELYRGSPRPLARVAAFEDAAVALRRTGDKSGATALLEEAGRECAAAGAQRAAARIEAVLQEIAPRRRRRAAAAGSGLAGLTAAELEVARRVAAGLSNRKVAAELFKSPHTVDSHLRHIFGKLAINNRVELAAYMAQQDRPA